MKIRHLLLLGLTLTAIVFFQPMVQLLGGAVLIASALAYIYSDLPADKQVAWDRKIARLLQRTGLVLKRRARLGARHLPPTPQPRKRRLRGGATARLEDDSAGAWRVSETVQPAAKAPDAPADRSK